MGISLLSIFWTNNDSPTTRVLSHCGSITFRSLQLASLIQGFLWFDRRFSAYGSCNYLVVSILGPSMVHDLGYFHELASQSPRCLDALDRFLRRRGSVFWSTQPRSRREATWNSSRRRWQDWDCLKAPFCAIVALYLALHQSMYLVSPFDDTRMCNSSTEPAETNRTPGSDRQ